MGRHERRRMDAARSGGLEMTAKEQQRMRRLEIENSELRDANKKHFDVHRDNLLEIIELRAKLALIESALRGDDGNP